MEWKDVITRLDKRVISIKSDFDDSDDKAFWFSRTPQERLQYLETLRRMNYGNRAAERLSRVLEIAERTGH